MSTFSHSSTISINRRRFLMRGATAASLAGMVSAMPAWARGANVTDGLVREGFDEVSGSSINLTVGQGPRLVQGRSGHAIAVNGSVPGPLVRLKEGTTARLTVHNTLDTDTSIHWHGLLVPFQMDGVPGVSFPGIPAGGKFTAEFPVRQAGTYWWHSHAGLQEQAGHYGPIVIDPAGSDPVQADREYVLLLSEFSPLSPHTIFEKLKKGEGYFNYQQTSWTDNYPLTAKQRREWAKMRMMPTDILDVTGSTYTYLANGHGPEEGLEFAFRPKERIRLRIINGSAMTFFNVRIPGLPMTVVAADGQNVRPVETDEFQIGVAETYDVLIEPGPAQAYTIVAEAMDRSGMALATLAAQPGARAAVPALRDPPLLTMADMGMGTMGMSDGKSQDKSMNDGMAMGGMEHGSMAHSSGEAAKPTARMDMGHMSMRDTSKLPATVKVSPGLGMVAMHPVDRMGDPGIGLADVAHRVLDYKQLAAFEPNKDLRVPSRLLEIHLTGSMDRYMWSFDGRKFSAVSDDPIRFANNERVRVKLVNDTMMAHPIHLHGHFFELVNGEQAARQPRKHTVVVQPGGIAEFDLTANEPGDWAFHCHLLYHMHAGMFQIVSVAAPREDAA
ncbi:MAG: copper resistance system multicopper oxidase [Sphingomonadaceae bacterium]